MLKRLLFAIVLLPIAALAAPPSFEEVRARYVPSEAVLLDRAGVPLSEVRVDLTRRRLAWVPMSEISSALVAAIVAAEDRRFYEHSGVDWRALAAAAWDNLRRGRPRGASTITMQLAAQLDPELAAPRGGRSLAQKWRQARAARDIEGRWTKPQILEAYLNLTSFRGELEGVHAAARGLFGKHPAGLDADEARLLAALVRAPNAAPRTVARRACAIAGVAATSGDCMRLERIASLALKDGVPITPRRDAAPHLAQALLDRPGAHVTTTLDAGLQRMAHDSLRRHLLALADRNVQDGAVLVLDNRTGDVLAYVASSGDLSDAAQVDGITAYRQAGSTLKPFLYQLAIERRWLSAASVLDDSPLHVTTPVGLYVPQNYDRDFKGAVSLRTALASSLNVPAVRTLLLAGFEAFHERLRALGFASLTEPADYYGYSLALGGADVSLLELTNAYRALANGGMWSSVRFMPGETVQAPRRVMDAGAVHIVSDILADAGARVLTFGFASPLETRFWAAVKTGTSKDMRDNWAIGFSERYTVGVWVGNFAGDPMWDVSGISGAAPVWHEVMSYLHREVPSRPPAPPAGVLRESVRFDPPIEPSRTELFLSGTETRTIRLISDARPRIAYPGDGSILALDPDIPPARQRVALHATPSRSGLRWSLDGGALGPADSPLLWAPLPGRHRLSLTDASGAELDVVRFQVRTGHAD